MDEKQKYPNPLSTYSVPDIDGIDSLIELAMDLVWSWNHGADKVWQQLDPSLWNLTHNPWVVLQTVSRDKLKNLLADPVFRKFVDDLVKRQREEAAKPRWFQETYSKTPLTSVAYFSMEYMLCEALPIYSGGLGNVAGDQFKAASDLGVPVTAIGLLYQQGYFRQMIDRNGAQQVLYPYNDPLQLPITPVRRANGEWLRIEIALPGWSVWLRVWQVQLGRLKLYLMDSNDAANFPAHRGITNELYGGGPDLRMKQEIVLGIGGWRLLKELGIKPEVCHLNEGHAAFAVLERARDFMEESGQSFEVSLAATRAGNLFTTHTAVPVGFDLFSPDLINQYLGKKYIEEKLKISLHDFLAFGRKDPNDVNEPFNMAYLAIRGSGGVNGVSRLHGKVSREMFEPLFPHWPEAEVPVGYVTNGVHTPTWDSITADEFWTDFCGECRWQGTTEELQYKIRDVPDAVFWKMRNISRKYLIDYTRERLMLTLASAGRPQEEVESVKLLFDPHILTLGFARRFATYKRPNMLLQDPARLLRILTNPERPVQLILAGKAHPADKPGQAMIQQWLQFIRGNPDARAHIVFLPDYDMLLTGHLVGGVDVWMNTPRRPWEACGTSGMKVLVNGGLNLSELDGWWAEAYTPEVGWAIGDGKEHGNDPQRDAVEANDLYDLLEKEVVPEFYNRNSDGIPVSWIAKIRESMARLTPQYSANRAVRQYTEEHYIPSAAEYGRRSANNGAVAKEIVAWEHTIKEKWNKIRFQEVKVETKEDRHECQVQVYLDDLDPKMIKIELYAEGLEGKGSVVQELKILRQLPGDVCTYEYQGFVPDNRPAAHYTARVIPYFPGVSVPLEESEILWQH